MNLEMAPGFSQVVCADKKGRQVLQELYPEIKILAFLIWQKTVNL